MMNPAFWWWQARRAYREYGYSNLHDLYDPYSSEDVSNDNLIFQGVYGNVQRKRRPHDLTGRRPSEINEQAEKQVLGILFLILVLAAITYTLRKKQPEEQPTPLLLLHMLLPPELREGLIGDLTEEFFERRGADGSLSATFWLWRQIICSLWPIVMMIVNSKASELISRLRL